MIERKESEGARTARLITSPAVELTTPTVGGIPRYECVGFMYCRM